MILHTDYCKPARDRLCQADFGRVFAVLENAHLKLNVEMKFASSSSE